MDKLLERIIVHVIDSVLRHKGDPKQKSSGSYSYQTYLSEVFFVWCRLSYTFPTYHFYFCFRWKRSSDFSLADFSWQTKAGNESLVILQLALISSFLPFSVESSHFIVSLSFCSRFPLYRHPSTISTYFQVDILICKSIYWPTIHQLLLFYFYFSPMSSTPSKKVV